ncbi:MAG TPA: CoA pyrophosphatase [Dehalococcoidia bacterium]|nr:CoA pyrophosphatase [Dehalococcoidia bacterium]
MPQTELWNAVRAAVDEHAHEPLPSGGHMAAAVLIGLVPYDSGPHVIFQVRSFDVEHHKGEISFPGGAADPEDADLMATALRESQEELGIDPTHVEVLGEQSHYVTHTGFHVTPYVGILDRAPYPYVSSDIEVAEVLDIPMHHLLNQETWSHVERDRDGVQFQMRSYHWREHVVWGATAMMLRSFLVDVAAQLGMDH